MESISNKTHSELRFNSFGGYVTEYTIVPNIHTMYTRKYYIDSSYVYMKYIYIYRNTVNPIWLYQRHCTIR